MKTSYPLKSGFGGQLRWLVGLRIKGVLAQNLGFSGCVGMTGVGTAKLVVGECVDGFGLD
jgi:hypothetical protein